MKADTNEVLAFQTWLSQSIRRAWILAFAVAIPGAFLVMWWFPHSGLALVVVAAVGIGIGVISDSIEVARNRRRQEIDELVTGVPGRSLAVYDAGPHIQRGVERERSVPVIFEAVPLGPSR